MNTQEKVKENMELAERFLEEGNLDKAEELVKEGLELDSTSVATAFTYGRVFYEKGQYREAVDLFKQLVKAVPDMMEAYRYMCLSLEKLGEYEMTVGVCDQVLRIKPDFINIHIIKTSALFSQEKFDETEVALRKALEYDSDEPILIYNLGRLLHEKWQFAAAEECYRRVLVADPNHIGALNNLGICLRNLRKLEESLECFNKVLSIDAENTKALNNISSTYFDLNRLKDGFNYYTKRWEFEPKKSHIRPFPQKWWQGESLQGKSLLIWDDQGVGDKAMFTSMIDEVVAQSKKIVIEAEKRLVPVFERSFPDIEVICADGNNKYISGKEVEEIDFHTPLSGMAEFLRTDFESFPKKDRYIKDDEEKTSKLRQRYEKEASGRYIVGISWATVALYTSRERTMLLEQFKDLLDLEDCFFVNLQYGDTVEEIKNIKEKLGISVYKDDEIDSLESIDDFVSQICALDHVVSIDNATVHFAGSVGKPVWTLLPFVQDWRWFIDRSDTPWYPSMKLFRQSENGKWDDVIADIVSEMKELLENRQ